MSKVIEFRKRDSQGGFLTAWLKDSLAKEDAAKKLREEDELKIAGAEARQVIARGVALLREAEGNEVADQWLVACMSVVRTIGE